MTAGPGTMRLRVRLFAMLRERAGCDALELTLPAGATVADAIAALGAREDIGELVARLPVVLAVNREYADGARTLAPGDEVAVIPPVAGGAAEPGQADTAGGAEEPGQADAAGGARGRGAERVPDVWAHVGPEPIDLGALVARVGRPSAGAIVTFLGTTRDVARLEYEAYAEMAAERIAAILRDCRSRHGLAAVAAAHRTGPVALGEASVGIAASAAHRAEAFAGAREAIDRIKVQAPIWKKEIEAELDGAPVRERWVEGSLPPPDAAV